MYGEYQIYPSRTFFLQVYRKPPHYWESRVDTLKGPYVQLVFDVIYADGLALVQAAL